ncbi:carbohydrate kinase family protein, partial [Arthrobacter deserti]|nr:carbohydrate kinase family protein [Arthrobacter deserti]
AASRLGLQTTLATAFGDDVYGEFNQNILGRQEYVDLSLSRRFQGWHSPVSVSLSTARDRSFATHGHPAPMSASELIGGPPRCRAAVTPLGPDLEPWALAARDKGALLFGDVGWDPTGQWPADTLRNLEKFYAFTPNDTVAVKYTRTDDPWAALYALADRVPVAVVTLGARGAIAIDSTTGEEDWAPALPVQAYDATGAGDCFSAAFLLGTLACWRLTDRLAFANLCAALSVQQFGGSLAAPGWGDIADWWERVNTSRESGRGQWLRRYAFLEELVSGVPRQAVRRAAGTVARHSDAGGVHLPSRPGERMDG